MCTFGSLQLPLNLSKAMTPCVACAVLSDEDFRIHSVSFKVWVGCLKQPVFYELMLNNSYFWLICSRVVGSYPFASSHFPCKNLTFLVYHKNLFRTDSSSTLWSAGSLMVDSGHHSFGFRYLHSLKLTRHLKIGHPKRNRVFQASIFRCKLLVSGRVYFNQSINLFFPGTPVTRPNVKHPEQNVWNATIPMILHPGPPTQPPQGCRPTLSLRCRRFVEWREASLTCIS